MDISLLGRRAINSLGALLLPSLIVVSFYGVTGVVGNTDQQGLEAPKRELTQLQFAPAVSPSPIQLYSNPAVIPARMHRISLAEDQSSANRLFGEQHKSKRVTEQKGDLLLTQATRQPNAKLSQAVRQGNQVVLNGRKLPIAWIQRPLGNSVRTSVSDSGFSQKVGIELLSTADLTKQPIQWFSQPNTKQLVLATQRIGSFRYLDITDFAKANGWQLQVEGTTLSISSMPGRVTNVQQVVQPLGEQIVVDLDRPTPWQVTQQGQQWVVTLEGTADSRVLERFQPLPPPDEREGEGETGTEVAPIQNSVPSPQSPVPSPQPPSLIVETSQNQTSIRGPLPAGLFARVSTIPNPNRLVIQLQPEMMVERDILWAPGIRWRQQYVSVSPLLTPHSSLLTPHSSNDRFPVVALTVNLRSAGLTLKPIWSNPSTQVGIAPLIQTAQNWKALAAINGGFFNRKNQLPLGAIRRDGKWLSGPILNRGAIAWNEQGQVKMGRLSLQEILITSAGERLPVLYLNSGYVQAGIARYTPEWGSTYTPLTDNEILVVVQNNQVTDQLSGDIAGKMMFPIPSNGYLLAIRANPMMATALPVGTSLQMESTTIPAEFNRYPQIIGAGPLLLENRQIVLDAKAEQFSDAFIREAAVRSAIGTTLEGNLMIVSIHNRIGGRGPTLAETAQLMQQMGAVDALNLDGGSSTSLYLGGQLINRPSYTAARVHNGLGLFLSADR